VNGYHEIVERALAAVAILSPTSYSWFGSRGGDLAPEIEAEMDSASARAYLVYQLQTRFYEDFYCRGDATPTLPVTQRLRFGPSPFVNALSAANSGSGSRESGWTVVSREAAVIVVERGGLRLWATLEDVYATNGGKPEPGMGVGVLMPKELFRLSPGFYMALGNAEFPVGGPESIIRLYWNLRSEGAVTLVRLLTRALNEARLAFRLKVVSEPDAYTRCDAGVLYVLAAQYQQVAELVADAHSRLQSELRSATPAFTKALARGLGLAEDPTGGLDSFGLNRCRLLAEAVVEAAEVGAATLPKRLAVVSARFAQAGIDLDAPYLNPGSEDRYSLP
jgi:hypothetical protein